MTLSGDDTEKKKNIPQEVSISDDFSGNVIIDKNVLTKFSFFLLSRNNILSRTEVVFSSLPRAFYFSLYVSLPSPFFM